MQQLLESKMHLMTVAALALTLLAGPVAAAETTALTRCNGLFDSSFDCACATKFLASRLDPDDLEILLPLWAYSLDGSGKHSAEFERIDERHGYKKVNQVLRQFHLVRLELFMRCPTCSPDRDTDE